MRRPLPPATHGPLLGLLAVLGAACASDAVSTDDDANQPPTATIVSPADGWVQPADEPLELRGIVGDAETATGDLRLFWRSDLDGVLYDGAPGDAEGNHALFVDDARAGEHRISLEVLDGNGATTRREVTVTVAPNTPPTCSIVVPGAGDLVRAPLGGVVELIGQVADAESAPTHLDVTWRDGAGTVLEVTTDGDGESIAELPARSGPQTVTLEVEDPSGAGCVTDVSFTVNLLPSAPLLRIDPVPASIHEDLVGVITAESLDPEGGAVTYTWAWLEDGFELPALREQQQVPAALLARDEVWTLEVRAHDLDGGISQPGVASVTIPNTAPDSTGLSVAFQDDPPTQALDLHCVVESPATDADAGDVVSYLYAWMLDGQPKPFSTSTVAWTETAIGQDWTCIVTPTDGAAQGTPASVTTTIVEGCGGLSMAGTNGEVTVPDATPLRLAGTAFTVEAWFQVFDLGGTAEPTVIASKRDVGFDNGWLLGVCGQNAACSGSVVWQQSADGDPVLLSQAPVQIGAWTHVAYVFDFAGGEGQLFVNGTLVDSAPMNAPNGGTTADLVIGNDSAGQPGTGFSGVIDDVLLTSTAQYVGDFTPPGVVVPGPNTIAWWGFEELIGTTTTDLSGFGHDGTLSGAASFTGLSSCAVDRPPNDPVLTLTPGEPALSVPLTCDASVPSVDPEGLAVNYVGEWYQDGVSTGLTFTSLPTVLPGSNTGTVSQWSCEVTASDGTLSSGTVQTAIWVGYEDVCDLVVSDTTLPASTGCTWTAPGPGALVMTVSNPDSSLDGTFSIDLGAASSPFTMATGGRDYALSGPQTLGWAEFVVKVGVDPSLGALPLTIDYATTGGSSFLGTDTLEIDFVPGSSVDVLNAVSIGYSAVSAQDSTPTTLTDTLQDGWFLILEAADCGTGGGGHSLYVDNDGSPTGDGIFTVLTGDPATCFPGVFAIEWPDGPYTFTLAPEDADFSNNVGDRAVALWKSDG